MNDSEFDSEIAKWGNVAAYFARDAMMDWCRYWLRHCESPIEKKFILEMCDRHQGSSCFGPPIITPVWIDRAVQPLELGEIPVVDRIGPQEDVLVFCQQRIGRYRVDFLVIARDSQGECKQFVVECDGHEFHERTKKQAQSDRARDRDLTLAGYTVLRYTGSEIHADATNCMNDLWDHIGKFLCRDKTHGV